MGQNATITLNTGTNQYTLRYQENGFRYIFDRLTGTSNIGILASTKDQNDNVTTVDHGGTNQGNRYITGDLGGQINFNTTGGYLTGLSVTSGASTRNYGYTLDPTTHSLTTYTDPSTGSPQTTYGYDPTSGLLTTIKTPTAGGATEWTQVTYDTIGRVTTLTQCTTSSSCGAGYTTTFVYTNTAAGTAAATKVYDAKNGYPSPHFTTYTMGPNLLTTSTLDPAGRTRQRSGRPKVMSPSTPTPSRGSRPSTTTPAPTVGPVPRPRRRMPPRPITRVPPTTTPPARATTSSTPRAPPTRRATRAASPTTPAAPATSDR